MNRENFPPRSSIMSLVPEYTAVSIQDLEPIVVKKSWKKLWLLVPLVFILVWVFYPTLPVITLSHVNEGYFAPKIHGVMWAKGQLEGYVIQTIDKKIIAVDPFSHKVKVILDLNTVKIPNLKLLLHFTVSNDQQTILFSTEPPSSWRTNTNGEYYVYHKEFHFLGSGISGAFMSPDGKHVVVAKDRNLFLVSRETNWIEKQISFTQNEAVSNGIADYIYQEEVFEDTKAVFWAPDSTSFAWLQFNDTNVPVYSYPKYFDQTIKQYPEYIPLRYPMPGTPNPEVKLFLTTLNNTTSFDYDKEWITCSVDWVNGYMLVHIMNRKQNMGIHLLCKEKCLEVRKEILIRGWIICHKVYPYKNGYLTIGNNNGYSHIAHYLYPNSSDPVFLTSGEWEVTEIVSCAQRIYFLSTQKSPHHRSLCLLGHECIHGYIKAEGSPNGSVILVTDLSMVPTQTFMRNFNESIIFEQNTELDKKLKKFNYIKPYIEVYGNISLKIYSQKSWNRPLLIIVYNGPGSQSVNEMFDVGICDVLASQNINCVIVDGAGTGFRGFDYMYQLQNNLGVLEVDDLFKAAKHLSSRLWVNKNRVGVWGWSYGGYVACKVAERNKNTFEYAIATAPVVDWTLYDSIYTERYLEDFKSSRVEAKNFNLRFMLMHGTQDYNVHFSNSMSLIRDLEIHNKKFDFIIYPESDHSMNGSYLHLLTLIQNFI